jgi:putative colanic acid biosynthesis acetyltransferase WcaF
MTLSYKSEARSVKSILELFAWRYCGQIIFNLLPLPLFYPRNLLLRLFGATIGSSNRIYPSVKVWLPRNLVLGSCNGIGHNVYLYNKAKITIGDGCVISQSSLICTASHDYSDPAFELYAKPISISNQSWIAASSIILPGVSIATGSVIGAGSILSQSTEPWTVYAGNPAVPIKSRSILSDVNKL